MSMAKVDILLEAEYASIRLQTLNEEAQVEESSQIDQTIHSLSQINLKLKEEIDELHKTSKSIISKDVSTTRLNECNSLSLTETHILSERSHKSPK